MSARGPLLSLLILAAVIASQRPASSQPATPPADGWLAGPYSYPKDVAGIPIVSNPAPILHAEIIVGHLKVFLGAAPPATNRTATVFSSQDSPGHWPSRDWRQFPMLYRGTNWEVVIPVDDLYAPVIYFTHLSPGTTAGGGASETLSAMRSAIPGRLGMEIPSHPFYPFIEGFEEGLHRWEIVGRNPKDAEMQIVDLPHDGKRSLQVRVPPRQTSVTVATTRIRGRELTDHHALGIRLWLRTRAGAGRARFTLFANAHGPEQISVTCDLPEAEVSANWQKIALPFSAFPALPIGEADWFAIEFIASPGTEFLLDDISLMGPWTLPGD